MNGLYLLEKPKLRLLDKPIPELRARPEGETFRPITPEEEEAARAVSEKKWELRGVKPYAENLSPGTKFIMERLAPATYFPLYGLARAVQDISVPLLKKEGAESARKSLLGEAESRSFAEFLPEEFKQKHPILTDLAGIGIDLAVMASPAVVKSLTPQELTSQVVKNFSEKAQASPKYGDFVANLAREKGLSPDEVHTAVLRKVYSAAQEMPYLKKLNVALGEGGFAKIGKGAEDFFAKKTEAPTPKTLSGLILSRGGLDSSGLKAAGYNLKELREFNLGHLIRKGGNKVDVIAEELMNKGILQVPNTMNPADALIETLKSKEARKLPQELSTARIEKEYGRHLRLLKEREEPALAFEPGKLEKESQLAQAKEIKGLFKEVAKPSILRPTEVKGVIRETTGQVRKGLLPISEPLALKEHFRLQQQIAKSIFRAGKRAMIKERVPSFGAEWTPTERKELYLNAMEKGLIYKDLKGKKHDKLHGIIQHYKDASFDQLKNYVNSLTGNPDSPPKVLKLYGDIDKDREVINLIKQDNRNWQDINKAEIYTLDPVRTVEKVTNKDLWADNVLADNTFNTISSADEAMFDKLVKEIDELEANKEGIVKYSKEDQELMRKYEANEPLTDKEQKIITFLRRKLDTLIDEANVMRTRLNKPLIPYKQNYLPHIIEQNLLSEFFKGNIDQMRDIPSYQLDAIRKGDYTKGNMPFNKFAQHRKGQLTKLGAIGNYEIYLKTILKEIYYSPAITHARKFMEYALMNQPNAYKSLDRMLNDLKGKQSIVDQNIFGALAENKYVRWMRGRLAKNALIGNINFWAINLSNFTISFDELGSYMTTGMAKFLGTTEWRKFAFEHSKMLKGRSIDPDIDPTKFRSLEQAVGAVTNLIEYNNVGSTFIGAYFKAIEKLGYPKEKAIKYADSIARRTQTGYKKYELNAWMRSNSGMLLSQFQSWAFNSMNHLIYDLKLGNVPENIGSIFTRQPKKPIRWGALFTLLATSMMVNYLYGKMGLRKPYGATAAIPKVPFITSSRYEEPGVVRIGRDIGAAFTAKKPETRRKAALRVGTTTLFPFGGLQAGRLATGRVFPEQKKEEKEKKSKSKLRLLR